MTVRMDDATALLVTDGAVTQLEAAYGGLNKALTATFAHRTANGGFLVELVVQTKLFDYSGVQVYICLFEKDGHMGSTIKEAL